MDTPDGASEQLSWTFTVIADMGSDDYHGPFKLELFKGIRYGQVEDIMLRDHQHLFPSSDQSESIHFTVIYNIRYDCSLPENKLEGHHLISRVAEEAFNSYILGHQRHLRGVSKEDSENPEIINLFITNKPDPDCIRRYLQMCYSGYHPPLPLRLTLVGSEIGGSWDYQQCPELIAQLSSDLDELKSSWDAGIYDNAKLHSFLASGIQGTGKSRLGREFPRLCLEIVRAKHPDSDFYRTLASLKVFHIELTNANGYIRKNRELHTDFDKSVATRMVSQCSKSYAYYRQVKAEIESGSVSFHDDEYISAATGLSRHRIPPSSDSCPSSQTFLHFLARRTGLPSTRDLRGAQRLDKRFSAIIIIDSITSFVEEEGFRQILDEFLKSVTLSGGLVLVLCCATITTWNMVVDLNKLGGLFKKLPLGSMDLPTTTDSHGVRHPIFKLPSELQPCLKSYIDFSRGNGAAFELLYNEVASKHCLDFSLGKTEEDPAERTTNGVLSQTTSHLPALDMFEYFRDEIKSHRPPKLEGIQDPRNYRDGTDVGFSRHFNNLPLQRFHPEAENFLRLCQDNPSTKHTVLPLTIPGSPYILTTFATPDSHTLELTIYDTSSPPRIYLHTTIPVTPSEWGRIGSSRDTIITRHCPESRHLVKLYYCQNIDVRLNGWKACMGKKNRMPRPRVWRADIIAGIGEFALFPAGVEVYPVVYALPWLCEAEHYRHILDPVRRVMVTEAGWPLPWVMHGTGLDFDDYPEHDEEDVVNTWEAQYFEVDTIEGEKTGLGNGWRDVQLKKTARVKWDEWEERRNSYIGKLKRNPRGRIDAIGEGVIRFQDGKVWKLD
ncbi:hypothetical protein BJ508DRAFT_325633 [Ascobolus immersus RN42]|uniref:Uncharacterized protein n=1 Tax=Ascobolus immersus RN42 TaxID=1160509 RepID=A0A3N4I8H2_ASCIM|nr:hypothetical protein BJ508DRAFT_325633 [Ascobolus immersus RN42]